MKKDFNFKISFKNGQMVQMLKNQLDIIRLGCNFLNSNNSKI